MYCWVFKVASLCQILSTNLVKKTALFPGHVYRCEENIAMSDLVNIIQVQVTFDIIRGRIVDKLNFTVVSCCTADGTKCESMVIFKPKSLIIWFMSIKSHL